MRRHHPGPLLRDADDYRYIGPLAEVYAARDIARAWSAGDRRLRRRAAIFAAILGLPFAFGLVLLLVTLVARLLAHL